MMTKHKEMTPGRPTFAFVNLELAFNPGIAVLALYPLTAY